MFTLKMLPTDAKKKHLQSLEKQRTWIQCINTSGVCGVQGDASGDLTGTVSLQPRGDDSLDSYMSESY